MKTWRVATALDRCRSCSRPAEGAVLVVEPAGTTRKITYCEACARDVFTIRERDTQGRVYVVHEERPPTDLQAPPAVAQTTQRTSQGFVTVGELARRQERRRLRMAQATLPEVKTTRGRGL